MKNKIALLPNVITAFGLTCGLFIIFKISMTGSGTITYMELLMTAGLLMLAGLADLLDGFVARAMHAESHFGGFFDSMSDAISFGVAPAVIVLKTLSVDSGTDLSFAVTAAAMVYAVCSVLRLVRFNVTTQNLDKHFTGLPIPAAAAAVVSANLFLASLEEGLQDKMTQAFCMIVVMVVIGYFMISRWKFPSFKAFHIRVGSLQLVALSVIFVAILYYGFMHHFSVFFVTMSWSYIAIAWALSITRLIAGRKSKTLEEFEPEPEEFN